MRKREPFTSVLGWARDLRGFEGILGEGEVVVLRVLGRRSLPERCEELAELVELSKAGVCGDGDFRDKGRKLAAEWCFPVTEMEEIAWVARETSIIFYTFIRGV